MRKMEMITMFNANCFVIPNNSLSLTHSLTHSLYSKHQNGATPERGRRDKRHIRLHLKKFRRGRKAFCVHTLTKQK